MDGRSSAGTLQSLSTYSLASKTGSSKSVGSNKLTREEDFTKDNVLSPVDLECAIQTERIIKILDEAIYKVKQVICLPELMKDGTLKAMLTEDEFEDLVFVLGQYEDNMSQTFSDMIAIEKIENGTSSMKTRLNPELGLLIYVLKGYPALKPIVENMVDQIKDGYTSYKTNPPQPALEYLLVLEQFRDLALERLECTAADELAAKFQVRKCETSNAKLTEKIQEYTTSLREEYETFQKTIASKEDLIAQLEKQIALNKYDSSMRLKKQILDSDRQMVLQSRAHAVMYEIVMEDDRESRGYYESTLKTNLIDEKKLRARKFKTETQLQSWVQKYDVEMADKQSELDDFLNKLEEETRKLELLEEEIAEQDKEYVVLMEERENEYHREMDEKMMKFRFEHAARVIQFAWRQVVDNRKEKKKLRKEYKRMKEAKEAAEEAEARLVKRLEAAEKKAAQEKKSKRAARKK